MKLHAWDTEVGGKPLRAFTRDKARKSLKRPVTVHPENVTINPEEWKYHGNMSTTGIDSDYIRKLHQNIKSQGFAIVELPKLKTRFHVFDVSFDVADVRVYSEDKELPEFKEFRKRIELSVHGDRFLGGEEKYLGEVDIPSEAAAKQMGIEDFHALQSIGFWVSIVRVSPREETFRRYLERELPKSLSKYAESVGVHLLDFRVDKVKFTHEDEVRSTPPARYPTEQPNETAKPKPISNENLKAQETGKNDLTELDKIIRYWKDRKWFAIFFVILLAIGGIAGFLKAIKEIWSFLTS